MNDPRVPANNQTWNPPSGDLTLDDLFAEPQPTTAPVVNPATAPAPPTGTATTQPETFVYTYKSREEAERGIQQKDAYIAQLRQELDKAKAQSAPAVPAPTKQPRFIDKVKHAVAEADAGRPEVYEQVMREFFLESMAPAASILMEGAKDAAVRRLELSSPGIRTFIGSDAYKAYLEERPLLKRAVEAAETDINYAPDLAQIYQVAYEASLGRRVQQPTTQSTEGTPPAPRPTLTPSTSVPPTPAPAQPDLRTREGREALIRDYEQRGIAGAKIVTC